MPYAKKTPGSKRALRAAKKRIRKSESKPIRYRYLIACEGKETEPNYFNELKNKLPRDIAIIAKGDGRNNLSLVEWAEQKKNSYKYLNGEQIDEVWIVMDRDSSPPYDFDNAIKSAEAKGYNVAWSNECFELWILLHFKEIHHALSREEIYKKLSGIFDFNYKKEGKNKKLYSLVRTYKGSEIDAINRAAKLWESKDYIASKANPATGVFKLINILNKYLNY